MKNKNLHNNLDDLFAGARNEQPVIDISEARSILHTKAGHPHATRPARHSIFSQPLKLLAIMTPAIGLLCLGLYMFLSKPAEQGKNANQLLSEINPHTAAKSVSNYDDQNQKIKATSPETDTLRVKKRIIIKDSEEITADNFKVINITQDSSSDIKDRNVLQMLERIAVFKEGDQSDSVISYFHNSNAIPVRDREQVISYIEKYTDTMALNARAQMKFRDSLLKLGMKFNINELPRPDFILSRNPDAAYKQVDSFIKTSHPELMNNYSINMKLAPVILNSDKDLKDKVLLYKFKGKADYQQNNKNVKNQQIQITVYKDQKQITHKDLLKDSVRQEINMKRINIGGVNHIESYQEYKSDTNNVKVITLINGKDLSRKRVTDAAEVENKLNSVPFLELDDQTLNKLGIVYNNYKVYYHGEVTKPGSVWKSAITLSMSPCVPPCNQKPDTALTSNYALKSKLKSAKRDFFPVFTSDRTGTDFRPVQFEREKLTNRAEFLKQANSLVPVIVKTNRNTFNMEDVVFWFAPTDEFFKLLPENVGKELSIEYKKLNQNSAASTEKNAFKQNNQIANDGTGENCKYFEVCRTNSGAITNSFIYPNPASTQFNLMLGLQGSRNIKISLLDIQGKLIKELLPSTLKMDGKHNLSFQIDEINRGVYLVLVESDQGEQSIQRLVVDK